MYNIIEAKKDADNQNRIIHAVDVGKAIPVKFIYSTIRGGLSWPNQTAPGYYIILGQIHQTSPDYGSYRPDRSPLKFLAEGQNEFIQELFAQLTDDAKMLMCEDFYCAKDEDSVFDPKGEWQGYVESFNSYVIEKKIEKVYLRAAPYLKNFQFGTSKIREWRRANALNIPQHSVVYGQLKRMTMMDLQNDPEINFYAVNALRYVINDFHKHSQDIAFIRKPKLHGRLSWMAR